MANLTLALLESIWTDSQVSESQQRELVSELGLAVVLSRSLYLPLSLADLPWVGVSVCVCGEKAQHETSYNCTHLTVA